MPSTETPTTIDVIFVEDDEAQHRQLAKTIEEANDLQLVASFSNGATALQWDGKAEIALVDLGLPDIGGVEVIREFRGSGRVREVMAYTVFEEANVVVDAIAAGASSYVLKGDLAALVDRVRELHRGGAPMSPRIARTVVERLQQQNRMADQYVLSPRETEVLHALEEGFSYKEIGARLHLSRHTIHSHIKKIYEKLHASSRAEALTKAKWRGLL